MIKNVEIPLNILLWQALVWFWPVYKKLSCCHWSLVMHHNIGSAAKHCLRTPRQQAERQKKRAQADYVDHAYSGKMLYFCFTSWQVLCFSASARKIRSCSNQIYSSRMGLSENRVPLNSQSRQSYLSPAQISQNYHSFPCWEHDQHQPNQHIQ